MSGFTGKIDRTQLLKDAARALSLANLFFIGEWILILDTDHELPEKFLLFGSNNILSLVLNIVILAAVFMLAMDLARHSKKPAIIYMARLTFFLTLIAALSIILFAHYPQFNLEKFGYRVAGYFNISEIRILGSLLLSSSAIFLLRRFRYYRFVVAGTASLLLWIIGST